MRVAGRAPPRARPGHPWSLPRALEAPALKNAPLTLARSETCRGSGAQAASAEASAAQRRPVRGGRRARHVAPSAPPPETAARPRAEPQRGRRLVMRAWRCAADAGQPRRVELVDIQRVRCARGGRRCGLGPPRGAARRQGVACSAGPTAAGRFRLGSSCRRVGCPPLCPGRGCVEDQASSTLGLSWVGQNGVFEVRSLELPPPTSHPSSILQAWEGSEDPPGYRRVLTVLGGGGGTAGLAAWTPVFLTWNTSQVAGASPQRAEQELLAHSLLEVCSQAQ